MISVAILGLEEKQKLLVHKYIDISLPWRMCKLENVKVSNHQWFKKSIL